MDGFAYSNLYLRELPPPVPRWDGFPPFYFVGGNNDPTLIPCEQLAEAAAAVLRRDGAGLAIYNMGLGPQGYPPLRDFVASKLAARRGIERYPRRRGDHLWLGPGDRHGLQAAGRPRRHHRRRGFLLWRGDQQVPQDGIDHRRRAVGRRRHPAGRVGGNPGRAQGQGRRGQVHLHDTNDPEPDRQYSAA